MERMDNRYIHVHAITKYYTEANHLFFLIDRLVACKRSLMNVHTAERHTYHHSMVFTVTRLLNNRTKLLG